MEAAAVASRARVWWLACRPATLGAAVAPVAVGAACAARAGAWRVGPTVAALVGALLLQVGANLANDVYDAQKGADTDERLGPTRAVAAGLLDARAVRRAMALVFAAATLVGAYLVAVAGPSVVVVGVAAIAAALAYTGGPWPLGYHGLGDALVMLFFGFVAVCGTAFVATGRVPAAAWWASLPPGALATAILVVNNLRDRATDEKAGKRTLAVRLGRRGAVAEYFALLAVAYAVPVGMALAGRHGALWALASLPFAVAPAGLVAGAGGRALNAALVGTARLLVVHALLFAAGLLA